MPISETRPGRAALRAWFAFRMLRSRHQAQPTDVPAIRSGDPRADRVLLVGNGPSHGWGVVSHQLGLTGELAHAVTARTGRPCDIDLIGAEAMNVRSALAWVGDRDLAAVDVVVLMIGSNDALRLTPQHTWRRELSALLDGLLTRTGPGSIAVAGIPPLDSYSPYGALVANASERHRARLNTISRQVAAHRRILFIDLPGSADARSRTADAYRDLAAFIADRIAPRILETRPVDAPRPALPGRTWQWSGTPAIVAAARDGGEPDLRRLTEQAQKDFGVELAVVSLVDGDRLFHGTNTDVVPESVPLELSFCRYTVETGEAVVIPDTGRDPRFTDNPLVDVSFINFYAGIPLHAADGTVIGSFCLQGSRPHRLSPTRLDDLRRVAAQAEAVLQRHEQPPIIPMEIRSMPAPTGAAITLP